MCGATYCHGGQREPIKFMIYGPGEAKQTNTSQQSFTNICHTHLPSHFPAYTTFFFLVAMEEAQRKLALSLK